MTLSSAPPRPTRPLSRSRRWAVTVGATALSTYALDAVATAAGTLLAASHLARGLDQWLLLSLLAVTYVAWGAGLRANLGANWKLLEETGMSTNALSKAGHDLASHRAWNPRASRIAAGVGYVGTEVAKELPYYAGALGAAALSDYVSTQDALIFLAGANLGAAGYEYGLAAATRAFLRRRASRTACGGTTGGTASAGSYPPSRRQPPSSQHATRSTIGGTR